MHQELEPSINPVCGMTNASWIRRRTRIGTSISHTGPRCDEEKVGLRHLFGSGGSRANRFLRGWRCHKTKRRSGHRGGAAHRRSAHRARPAPGARGSAGDLSGHEHRCSRARVLRRGGSGTGRARAADGRARQGDDDASGLTVAPGATEELTLTFDEPGETLAGCHIPGHYPAGMKAVITISP